MVATAALSVTCACMLQPGVRMHHPRMARDIHMLCQFNMHKVTSSIDGIAIGLLVLAQP